MSPPILLCRALLCIWRITGVLCRICAVGLQLPVVGQKPITNGNRSLLILTRTVSPSSPLSQRIYRTIPGIFSPTFTNPTLPEKGGMPHTITGGEALHFGNLLMVANEPSFGQKPINKTNPRPDFCFCDLNWKRIASASLALQWRQVLETF